MRRILTLAITLFFISQVTTAQEINQNRKKLEATRTDSPPRIDGELVDDAWANAPVANNFVMMRPDNGKSEVDTHKTEVKLVYMMMKRCIYLQ